MAAIAELQNLWQSQREQSSDEEWPHEAWQRLVEIGGCRWGIPSAYRGEALTTAEFLDVAIELTRGDLTPAFIWTQSLAAIQRLDKAPAALQEKWFPRLAEGKAFATVGISHLTTSRQHWTKPTVVAVPQANGYRMTGSVPWVTGVTYADIVVTGAVLDDGRQLLIALDMALPGVIRGERLPLLALRGSMTGSIELDDVMISSDDIIAGPVDNVLKAIGSGGAGSFMTSAVAMGHAFGSFDELERITAGRAEFDDLKAGWHTALADLREEILVAAQEPVPPPQSAETLRVRATTLALQMSQSLLTASKGAGFVHGHPAERMVREAMFFLVWSCPQAVAGKLLRGFGSSTCS